MMIWATIVSTNSDTSDDPNEYSNFKNQIFRFFLDCNESLLDDFRSFKFYCNNNTISIIDKIKKS